MLRRARALVLIATASSACTADFFLEQDTDISTTGPTTGMASASDSTLSASAGSAEGSSTEFTTAPDPTTTTAPTSEGGESTTVAVTTVDTTETSETSVETTTETTAETTASSAEGETDPTGEGGGVLDCPQIDGPRGCDGDPACDWFPDFEICFADPCHADAEIVCTELLFEQCSAAPLCTWFGELEGVCGYAPCPELDIEACMQSAACQWILEPASCIYRECPTCYDLGELDCIELESCTWLDVQEACVPD